MQVSNIFRNERREHAEILVDSMPHIAFTIERGFLNRQVVAEFHYREGSLLVERTHIYST